MSIYNLAAQELSSIFVVFYAVKQNVQNNLLMSSVVWSFLWSLCFQLLTQ